MKLAQATVYLEKNRLQESQTFGRFFLSAALGIVGNCLGPVRGECLLMDHKPEGGDDEMSSILATHSADGLDTSFYGSFPSVSCFIVLFHLLNKGCPIIPSGTCRKPSAGRWRHKRNFRCGALSALSSGSWILSLIQSGTFTWWTCSGLSISAAERLFSTCSYITLHGLVMLLLSFRRNR